MNEIGPLAIEHELRRIGVDLTALGGLASSGGTSAADLLTWLRRLPTGLGHAAFLERLRTLGPRPGDARGGIPPRKSAAPRPSNYDLGATGGFPHIVVDKSNAYLIPGGLFPPHQSDVITFPRSGAGSCNVLASPIT